MKKLILLPLMLLAACASQSNSPRLVEQPTDAVTYQVDLARCEDWAAPTRNEWARRCAMNGEMVMMSRLIASMSDDDARDKDAKRQSMPNDTKYRLGMCMQSKGYKVDLPDQSVRKVAWRITDLAV